MELRELRGDDIFTMLAIVGKLDIKDDFVRMFENNAAEAAKVVPMDKKKKEPTKKELAAQEAAAQRRGMEVAAEMLQTLLLNLNKVKGDINAFLAELAGVNVAEIEALGLKDYTGLLIGFFKKPELTDFFGSIASLLK